MVSHPSVFISSSKSNKSSHTPYLY
jgi:hypothetical protein